MIEKLEAIEAKLDKIIKLLGIETTTTMKN